MIESDTMQSVAIAALLQKPGLCEALNSATWCIMPFSGISFPLEKKNTFMNLICYFMLAEFEAFS